MATTAVELRRDCAAFARRLLSLCDEIDGLLTFVVTKSGGYFVSWNFVDRRLEVPGQVTDTDVVHLPAGVADFVQEMKMLPDGRHCFSATVTGGDLRDWSVLSAAVRSAEQR